MIDGFEDRPIEELERIRKEIDRSIADFQKRQMAALQKALRRIAVTHGLTPDELLDAARERGRPSRVKMTYANPRNPAQTWSGHGRQPNWYLAAVRQGTPPRDMVIERNDLAEPRKTARR